MSDTYTKLFRSITASTIVSEPLATRWLWVTMLSQADSSGCVWGSVPGLARLANITLEECEIALACFYAPDPYSRTQDNEGRRIESVDGGWRLLNHAKYGAIRAEAERAEYKRQWDRKHRPSGHARAVQSDNSPTVRHESDTSPTKPDSPTTPTPTPTLQDQKQEQASPRGSRLAQDWTLPDDWREWARAERPDVDVDREAASFADFWHGKAGKDARKADWMATWRNWIRNSRHGQSARAGPLAPQSQRMTAIQTLMRGKTDGNPGLAGQRDQDGVEQAGVLVPGFGAGR